MMDPKQAATAPGAAGTTVLLPALYVAAVFTSALLLFAVQPMFTRMVLPRLGGTPAVWSVAMVFFQSMLLAGYAYAHLLTKARQPLVSVAVHLGLLVAAALTLPLSIAEGWGTPPATGEALWLLGLFTVSIGLPFFALSANNPLLQAWFVRTGHPGADNPYSLYAASNIGSFLALLAYPVLLEPMLPLRDHLRLWTGGFYLLIVLIAACGYRVAKGGAAVSVASAEPVAPPVALDYGRWIALSAVPSGLLVAVTAHISTDVAAAPLLWVLPLSLYLITWVIVFQQRPVLPHGFMVKAAPFAIVGLTAVLALQIEDYFLVNLGAHLLGFFVLAMACHGELSRRRPAPAHLTAFYLSLSAGGVVGGVFAGLIAPNVFSWIAEYPILIALAILCLPRPAALSSRLEGIAWPLAAAAALALAPGLFGYALNDAVAGVVGYAIAGLAALALLVTRRPIAFAVVIGLALALIRVYPTDGGRFQTSRSFFGVLKVRESLDGRYRVLLHGTTVHGAQMIRDEAGQLLQGRPQPISYYHDRAPLTQAIASLRDKRGPLTVALVGLGTGSFACRKAPGETWRLFEIDPNVVRVAREQFSFLSACAPDVPIVLGDARLMLAREPDGFYDAIVVDAFSSDAIPVHLMTQEAMAMYRSKLKPGGAIVMHVSNKHLELMSVVAGIAAANGLKVISREVDEEDDDDDNYLFASDVAVVAKDIADLGLLSELEDWTEDEPTPGERVWTDDYSNIVGAMIRKER